MKPTALAHVGPTLLESDFVCGGSMNEGRSMSTIKTPADLHCEGWHLTAHCLGRTCGSGRKMDLAQLIARFGADHTFISDTKIPPLLVCGRCGQKGGTLTISAPERVELV